MDTRIWNESLQKNFDDYQKALKEKYDGKCYTSHQDSDSLYRLKSTNMGITQSYPVNIEEFFLKASSSQLLTFKSYFKSVVNGGELKIEMVGY